MASIASKKSLQVIVSFLCFNTFVLFFGADSVRAETAEEVEAALEMALESVADASNSLMDAGLNHSAPDLATATTSLDTALALHASLSTSLLDPSTVTNLGTSFAKFNGQVKALGKAIAKTRSATSALSAGSDTSSKSIQKAAKTFGKINQTGERAFTAVAPATGQPFIIVERSRTGGFGKPYGLITFELRPNPFYQPACTTPATVEVINPLTAEVLGEGSSQIFPRVGVPFTVQLGPDGGGARMRVTACGVTRERIVQNYGSITQGYVSSGCDGVYTGVVTGTVKGQYLNYDAWGDPIGWVSFSEEISASPEISVSNGLASITNIDPPFAGTGRVWPSGISNEFRAGGSTRVMDVPVIFSFVGKCAFGVMSGTWQASFNSDEDVTVKGSAKGKWTASVP